MSTETIIAILLLVGSAYALGYHTGRNRAVDQVMKFVDQQIAKRRHERDTGY